MSDSLGSISRTVKMGFLAACDAKPPTAGRSTPMRHPPEDTPAEDSSGSEEIGEGEGRGEFPLVSVIIPALNAGAVLADCLRSVAASDYPRLEVIVVSDASADNTVEVARRHNVRVLSNTRRSGAAHTRNAGASVAGGEIFFFVDADVVLNPDAISLGAGCLASGEADAVFGSYIEETRVAQFTARFKNYQHHFTHQAAPDDPVSFWSGCGAVTRGAFTRLAGFDVSLQYCEDIEFGHALVEAGFRVRLLKHMRAEHLKRYAIPRLLRSDLLGRALPWTRLMRAGRSPMGTLNTGRQGVISVALTGLMWLFCLGCFFAAGFAGAVLAALAGICWTNRRFLAFLRQRRGYRFAAASVSLLVLHYTICGLGFTGGYLASPFSPVRAPAPRYEFTEVHRGELSATAVKI